MYLDHPRVDSKLLEKIPRMETVAVIIEHQFIPFAAFAERTDLKEEICLGAQILRISTAFDSLLHRGCNRSEALHTLQNRPAEFNPLLLKTLTGIKLNPENEQIVAVYIRDLSVGMIAEQDIMALNGVLIAPKGQEVTWSLIKGLKNFSQQVGVKEPILVKTRKS